MTEVQSDPRAIAFDNSYARELGGLYVEWQPSKVPAPRTIAFNEELAKWLGLDFESYDEDGIAGIFSGNQLPPDASPLAQAYAGHQFGGLSPQLGDGRAVLLGEVIDKRRQRYDIQLKGSGRTPFSRGGDGKAALGPMLREYLISEAMHALGVPTTRALAIVATGEDVRRERALPGAILTRVAASHIRVGTFQFFAIRRDEEKLKRLADYSIRRHYPDLAGGPDPYIAFFEAVLEAQASLIAKWMLIGFVHGVMNTDNMTISGETIDYGPCAFIDRYRPDAVFSSIDEGGRYAYSNQPIIAQWNLARLAETLIPLFEGGPEEATRLLTNALDTFPQRFLGHWLDGMRAKLGLTTREEGDLDLANDLFEIMANQSVDFTQFFRSLASAVRGSSASVDRLFEQPEQFEAWFARYKARMDLEAVAGERRADAMDAVNPVYIPRNHKVEEALAAAVDGDDFAPFRKLLGILSEPFTEKPELASYAEPPLPGSGPYVTYCGT